MTKSTTARRAAWTQLSARRVLWIGALTLLASGGGCKARHDAKPAAAPAAAPEVSEDTVTPAPAAPAPAPVAAAPVEVMRPPCDQSSIRENGVAAVEIGDPQETLRNRCRVLGDSTATDSTTGTIRGNVVVGVGPSAMQVQIADGRVYRITVTDAGFRTADGLGPGVPVVGLLDHPGALVLEGEHDLSVVVAAHCGLYFRIAKPATVPENASRWSDIVRAMPEGTPVERVVVHGCR